MDNPLPIKPEEIYIKTPKEEQLKSLDRKSSIIPEGQGAIALIKSLASLLESNPEVKQAMAAALFKGKVTAPTRDTKAAIRAAKGVYYNEGFAKQLIPFLDKLMESENDITFPYAKFPNYEKTTLRSRIDQSFRYVVEHLDPDLKYLNLRAHTIIKMESNGVTLRHDKNEIKRHVDLAIAGEEVIAPDITHAWKRPLYDWLEQDWNPLLTKEECKFDQANLSLSQLEVTELEELIKPLHPMIQGQITNNRIFLVKINPQTILGGDIK